MKKSLLILLLLSFKLSLAQKNNYNEIISKKADLIEQKVIEWRHDFHQNPELGNHETRTAGIIAKHLKVLGLEVKTGVAVTGVLSEF